MFELAQEKDLLYSSDNSVRLTTHRVICQQGKVKAQVMIADIESYEFSTAHIGNYKAITGVFLVLVLFAIGMRTNTYFNVRKMLGLDGGDFIGFLWEDFGVKAAVIFFGLSLLFFFASRRHMLRLNGKYDSIEFRVHKPHGKSIQKFLQTLISMNKNIREKK